MSARAHGDPNPPLPQSPYVWESPDYQGKMIRITVTYDNVTRALTGATVFRDAACVYHRIFVGLGVDGTPEATSHKFNVPAGTTSVTAQQMHNAGFDTIEEFFALQITAGP